METCENGEKNTGTIAFRFRQVLLYVYIYIYIKILYIYTHAYKLYIYICHNKKHFETMYPNWRSHNSTPDILTTASNI